MRVKPVRRLKRQISLVRWHFDEFRLFLKASFLNNQSSAKVSQNICSTLVLLIYLQDSVQVICQLVQSEMMSFAAQLPFYQFFFVKLALIEISLFVRRQLNQLVQVDGDGGKMAENQLDTYSMTFQECSKFYLF